MSKKTYGELLRDPRWQRRRLDILNRADFACEECGDKTTTLNVHHKLYRKGAMPWEYTDTELACICETCHETEHQVRQGIAAAMAEMSVARLDELHGFAEGLIAKDKVFTDEEDQDRERKWPIRSYFHARGFLEAIWARAYPHQINLVHESGVLEFSDINKLGYLGFENTLKKDYPNPGPAI